MKMNDDNIMNDVNKMMLNSVKLLSMKGDELMQRMKKVNEELLGVLQLEKEIKENEMLIQTKKNNGVNKYQEIINNDNNNNANKKLLEKYILKLYNKERDLNKQIESIYYKESELFMKEYILEQLLLENNDDYYKEEGNSNGNNEEHKIELDTNTKRMINDTERNRFDNESSSSKENENNNNLLLLNNNSFTNNNYNNDKEKNIRNGNKTYLQEPPYDMKPQILCDELTNKNDIGELNSAKSQDIKSNEKQMQVITSNFLSKCNAYTDRNNSKYIDNVITSEINHEIHNCRNELTKLQNHKRKKSFIIQSKLTLPNKQHNNVTPIINTTMSPTKQRHIYSNNKSYLNNNISNKNSFNISVSLSQKQFNLLQQQNTRNTSIVIDTKNSMYQNKNNNSNSNITSTRSISPSFSRGSRNKYTPNNLFTSPLTSKTNSTTVYINPSLIKSSLVSQVKNEIFKKSPYKYTKQPCISLHKNSNYSRIIPYYNPSSSNLHSSHMISHFNCNATNTKQHSRISNSSFISKTDNYSIEKNRQHLNKANFKIKMNNFVKKMMKVFTKYKIRMYNTYIKKIIYFYDHAKVIRKEISKHNNQRKRNMIYNMFKRFNIHSHVIKLLKELFEKSAPLYNKKVTKVIKIKGNEKVKAKTKEKDIKKKNVSSDKGNSKDKIIARMKANEERRKELQKIRKKQEDKKRKKIEKEKQRIQEEERQIRVKHEIIQELKDKINNNRKILDIQSLNDKEEFIESQMKIPEINDLSDERGGVKFNTEFVDNELNEIDKLEEELKQSAIIQLTHKIPFKQTTNSFSIEQCDNLSNKDKQNEMNQISTYQILPLNNIENDLVSNENDNDDISAFQKELSILQEISSENKHLEESMKNILSKLHTIPSNSQQ